MSSGWLPAAMRPVRSACSATSRPRPSTSPRIKPGRWRARCSPSASSPPAARRRARPPKCCSPARSCRVSDGRFESPRMPLLGPGTTGFLLGKFLPPHRGHQYLIEFARAYVDRLTVLVCTIEQEPIPGRLRYQWMCEAFPGVDLVHHTDEIPQAPE